MFGILAKFGKSIGAMGWGFLKWTGILAIFGFTAKETTKSALGLAVVLGLGFIALKSLKIIK